MGTITINKLIGGSINIITGGDEPTITPVWGKGMWIVENWELRTVVYKWSDQHNAYYCVVTGGGITENGHIDNTHKHDSANIDMSKAVQTVETEKGVIITVKWQKTN